jgi:hypothetical protein
MPATAKNSDEAKKILEGDKDVDGYMVYMVGIWTGAPQAIIASGRPTLLVDDLYGGTGEFLIAYAASKRQGQKVAGVSSTRIEDVVQAAKCFECIKKLRSSVIVQVGSGFGSAAGDIEKVFGTKVVSATHSQLDELYKKADRTEARK